MTDNTRTYAIVVGIESYDLGESANLVGPASDALDCVEWLQKAGVPNDNIRLLIKPTAERRTKQVARAEVMGFKPEHIISPTRNNAEKTFRDMRRVDGDLLIVFWGGHGLVSGLKQRVLLCTDLTENDGCELYLDLELLRFGSTTTTGFEKQIYMIDACANFTDNITWESGVGTSLATGLKFDKKFSQAVVFASAMGTAAAQNQAQGYGEFSRVILKQLNQPDSKFPPDMDAVAYRVRTHFNKLRAEDHTIQKPVYCSTQVFGEDAAIIKDLGTGTTASRRHDDVMTLRQRGLLKDALSKYEGLKSKAQRDCMVETIWPLGCPSLTRSLDDDLDLEYCLGEMELKQKFNSMIDWLNKDAATGQESRLLAAIHFQATHRAISMANKIRRRLTNLDLTSRAIAAAFAKATINQHSPVTPRNLAHALEILLQQKLDSKMQHIGNFLLHLEHECGDAKIEPALLDECSIDTAKAVEIRHGLMATKPKKQRRLIVDFHGMERAHDYTGWPNSVTAQMQLPDDSWTPIHEQPCQNTLEGAQQAFNEVFTWAVKLLNEDVSIEIFAPRCLFDSHFEKWMVKETPFISASAVGGRCNVVLRWGERRHYPELQKNWRDRSQSISNALKVSKLNVQWVSTEMAKNSGDLRNKVSNSEDTHCVGFEFALPEMTSDLTIDPVFAALQGGVVYSILFRDGGDINILKKQTALHLMRQDVKDFPDSLKKLRANQRVDDREIIQNLIALWDDPFDLPPQTNATEPK